MMVQNAAFIPDAIPAQAAQSGMARGGAAPGAGGFQQLLQGKQTQGRPVEKQAAAAERPAQETAPKSPSRPAGAGEKPQPTQEELKGSARNGLPAEAAQTPAAQKAAVAGGKLPAQQAGQKKEPAKEQGAAAQTGGAEAPSGMAKQNAGVEQETATAPETAEAGEEQTAAEGEVPATQMRPDPNPGLTVAMAAVESNMAARSEGGNAEAGATALARLEALQQRLQQPATPQTAADANDVQPQQQQQAANQQATNQQTVNQQTANQQTANQQTANQQAVNQQTANQQAANQQNQPTVVPAGAKLSQEAELAKLSREERGAQVVPPTGATEAAQVEKPQAQAAPEKTTESEGLAPRLPEAAKTAVPADQAVAAAHLSAKQAGAGRFVAMPVRELSANPGEAATATDPAAANGTAAMEAVSQQENAQAQQGLPVQEQVATQGAAAAGVVTTGDATREAEAEQATLQGKVKLHEEQVTKKEQQTEPAQVSTEEAGQTAEKAPQDRELRRGEAVAGKEAPEAEQARLGNPAKPSIEEAAGGKGASSAAVDPASAEDAVKEMSGARGEQGQSQQKGQEQQNGQMLGTGVTAQGNSAEAAHAGGRPAGSRSPLHENILSQVREGVVTHDGKGNGQMSIRLNPGELGELKIQLSMENNRLNVQVHADNHMVKDLLMSNLNALKEALTGKNLTMEGFNVSTGGGGFNGPLNEERGNQRQQQASRFARGGGYGGQEPARVNYLTAEVNNLLDVRF